MAHKKCIAALISVAVVSVLLWVGCDMSVNDPIRNVPIFEPYISVQPSSYAFDTGDYTAPALSIQIAEWDKREGDLSFQWYTFATVENFFRDTATVIDGATKFTENEEEDLIVSSYTPNIEPAPGKTFYYYVVVTNTNPDAIGGKTSASVRSDVVTISFNVAGDLAKPVITQNPVDASYTMGRTAAIAALDVRATVSSGSLMYQWYRLPVNKDGEFPDGSFTDGKPNGILIPGATQRTYLPDMADLSSGKNYYYVVVSNMTTNPDGTVLKRTDTYSVAAVIDMALGEKAAKPRIEAQPKDILYFTTDTAARNLSVAAVSVDRGDLSYQWYSCSASGANPQEVGTNSSAFAAPRTAGYYYVIITNTNNDVKGSPTGKIQSKVAAVNVLAAAAGSKTANATITVDPGRKQQYIRGYGGMETTWGNFFQSDPEDMENMFNPDILGYNMWRIMIPPVTTNIDGDADGKGGLEEYLMAREYANRYYENVKIVNGYGGYVLASPWSPPKEWKSNNSINSGGNLMHQYYKQFANYLRSYARHMANHGAPIYAVSIANEPNYAGGYDGCEWTPEEMRDFYKEVGRFTQGVRGFGGGKVTPTVLTVNGESANNPDINHKAMDDPVSNAAIDLFARHVYGNQTERLWGRQNLNGREVWMTEHNINSASDAGYPMDSTWNYMWRFMNDVDLVIRLNNENAFVWWVVKRFYSFIGEGAAGTLKHAILPRGWGLAHYSKFSIDTIRVPVKVEGRIYNSSGSSVAVAFNDTDLASKSDTSNVNNTKFDLDNTSVRITAFMSRDEKELSLVMWTPTMPGGDGGYALGTAEIKMPEGFVIRSVSAMRSQPGPGGGTSGIVSNMGKWVTTDASVISIKEDRKSAFVTLDRSDLLSVKFIKE